MSEGKLEKKRVRQYMFTLVLISFAAFACNFRQILESYNSTVLAFSYKYGFISRGLLGTLYQGLDDILPVNLMSYDAAVYFLMIVSLIVFVIFIIIGYKLINLCPKEYIKVLEFIWVFFMIDVIITFSSKRNFGRLDIFMIFLSVIAVYCIIRSKAVWLCIPFSCLGVMVHQGYVFMYFSMILVLLVYQYIVTDEKKFLYVCIGSFLATSGLFLWFQFFSHVNGPEIVENVIREATLLSEDGEYHETLIEAEILGVDLTSEEWPMHVENWIELPFYIVLMLPYIVLIIGFFKNLIKNALTLKDKIKNWIIILGPITLLPNFILKVDYGRWILAVFIYYLIVFAAVIVLRDEGFIKVVREYTEKFKKNKVAYSILAIYPILFLPFWDVHICEALKNISNPINDVFLDLW